ncbi:hypothetical protein JOC85_000779 [Bacillus mesophilus]|uniref:Uncharacterized protein n=1 Tax=Bacillus mesophilus TaxID=1808955 RepID=A0A6M0Q3W6_9BACI|nr:hypothetical protein [Bacillus mesophilus]MBM7660012.1 hypothetical protein [Bacillus mesophilus]NEY70873.1 hypothetical protein [Bacillus mesophilus]
MTVNHAGALKKEYFIAYLKLVLNARECTIEEAKDITFNLFFRQNKEIYGEETYKQFLLAYQDLHCRLIAG